MTSAYNREHREQNLQAALLAAEKCSARVVQFVTGAEQEAALADLFTVVEGYCALDIAAKVNEESLAEATAMEQETAVQEDFKSIVYNKTREKMESVADAKTHLKYVNFDRSVKLLLEDVDGDNDGAEEEGDEDDDVRMTDAEVNYVDPISQQVMVSPVKNKICGHTYEKNSILELFKRKSVQRCPYVGCPHRQGFTKNDLEDDVKLKHILKKRQRTH